MVLNPTVLQGFRLSAGIKANMESRMNDGTENDGAAMSWDHTMGVCVCVLTLNTEHIYIYISYTPIPGHGDLRMAHALAAEQVEIDVQSLGTHQPRCAKLGFVGPARAGKTSTLRALSGLPLRP